MIILIRNYHTRFLCKIKSIKNRCETPENGVYYERFKNIKPKCSRKKEKIIFSFESRNE